MQMVPDKRVVSRPAIPITVNGKPRAVTAGATIADVLAELELDARLVVVERNGVIMRDRGALSSTLLEERDVLELVHFVGGG